jgi:GGDEF domain-containing protein
MLTAGVVNLAIAAYAWFQGTRPSSNHLFAFLLAAISLWILCIASWLASPSEAIALVTGQALRVTISIGVAIHAGAATTHIDELLRQADQALYAAKRAGRNRVMGAA